VQAAILGKVGNRLLRAPRFTIEVPFYFRRRGEGSWRQGMTDNISRSGVLFRTREALDSETPLEMHFALPLQVSGRPGAVVACRGLVVRAVPADSPDALPGFAATISRYRFVRRRSPTGA
jgi:PilZ domain-containing protein